MRRAPLHPFLLALYPVLFLYRHNIKDVRGSQVLLPAAAAVLLAAAAVLVSWVAVRRWRTAGLIASAFMVFFFSYGHFVDFAFGRHKEMPVTEADWLLALLWLGAFVPVAVFLRGLRGELRAATGFLNLLAAGLVAVTLVQIVPYECRRPSEAHLVPTPVARAVTGPLPDIYYIILDRYAGNSALKEFLAYDNGDFITFLQSRGFYVVNDGQTNYPDTAGSLVSSLNMCYLDDLRPKGADPQRAPAEGQLHDYVVQRFLKAHGYRYLHLGSWWEPTRVSPQADVNLISGGCLATEFGLLLGGTTLARPALAAFEAQDLPHRARRIARYQFAQLETIARRPGPKFVFAHLIVPHGPYVFDATGRLPTAAEAADEQRAYVQQLRYANQRLGKIVDRILADSKTAPIIILQGDHGPTRIPAPGEARDAWRRTLARDDRLRVSILNAYCLPGGKESKLYPTITPVNSFRLVFREYLGADCGLLPDRPWQRDETAPLEWSDMSQPGMRWQAGRRPEGAEQGPTDGRSGGRGAANAAR